MNLDQAVHANEKLTPLMQQYWEIKAQHLDKVLLFRMGDFFEMFHQDAETAAPILNIALTQRNKKANDSTKMCGVPHHSIAGPIARLLAAGLKVAICDQIEDPATAKGIVKRAVTRVLTPGMVYDPETLDEKSAHYLCAYDDEQVAFVDVTTGEALTYAVATQAEREELIELLRPAEVVVSPARRGDSRSRAAVSVFGADDWPAPERLLNYVRDLQGEGALTLIRPFEARRHRQGLRLSPLVLRHLEIFENARGGREGTLCEAIDRTRTSGGARLLKSWLRAPLTDPAAIQGRWDDVELWRSNPGALKELRDRLSRLGDVERRLSRLNSPNANARDLLSLADAVETGMGLGGIHPRPGEFADSAELRELARIIRRAVTDEPPLTVKEGGMIRRGVDPRLDEWIDLAENSQRLLQDFEARERESVGVASLKVRYNNVFGFYIELTKTHSHRAPAHYRRKQTLANAERYTTDELHALEEKILSARSKRDQLEFEIFQTLRRDVMDRVPELTRFYREWTRWDVVAGLAWLAIERRYARPILRDDGGGVDIRLGRHPVIEQLLKSGFVPNDVALSPGEGLLLTGPNMAGKSTLMRQVALIVILAQMGSFVPADSARLPVITEVLTRVGASDRLDEGLSTFMVEMTETARILESAGPNSLIVMDEIGRGTSTYDGMSLAQAILEYLVDRKKSYLLFATHYHELTALEAVFPRLKNGHMAISEKGGQIQFLHTLRPGPANKSYGIHVARLAGLPKSLTDRAAELLREHEARGRPGEQLALALPESGPLPDWIEEFRAMDLSRMTPLEALVKMSQWQREVSS